MPGLPMFGHGQIDGFEEKYGMEYRRSYRDEQSDEWLVERHEREIFPLMKKRYLFSGSADFRLYDFFSDSSVNENVFAYSNRAGAECVLILYNNSYSRASGWIKNAAVGKDRRAADSLCSALGLHAEDNCFALMRELRSSLWYIRSSKDIAERGLFAALDGYQTQVFLDIHEVRDSGSGGWARLNHELSGRGVPDLEAAKMDLVLGELYYRYDEIFKPGIVPGELKPLVIAFIETARAFIDGNGVYDPWVREPEQETDLRETATQEAIARKTALPEAAEQEAAGTHSPVSQDKAESEKQNARNRKTPEQVWDDFTVYLERMISVQAAFESGAASPAESACAGLGYAYAALALLRPIIGGSGFDNDASGAVAERDASGADAVSLALHWQLDRKLRETLCRLGMDGESAWHAVEILKTALSRAGGKRPRAAESGKLFAGKPADKKQSAKDLARNVILDNCGDDDFRRILGINVFDDVTWFNKEAFERALYYGSIFAAMEYGNAALVKDAADELKKAEKRSGYRLDTLIEALSRNPKKQVKAETGDKPRKPPGKRNA
jgi:hypothetical protein